MVTPDQIKQLTEVKLRPNPYLRNIEAVYPYQRRGSLMMMAVPRLILGDDVGIGKTLESIVTYTYVKEARPETKALVLTEKNALQQWVEEFKRWTTGIACKIITPETHPDVIQRTSALRDPSLEVVVTTYGMLYNYTPVLLAAMQPRWVLFADEPNYFKNPETDLYRNIRGIAVGDFEGKPYKPKKEKVPGEKYPIWTQEPLPGERPVRAYGLTATVIENRLEEAYSIASIVAPGIFESRLQFEKDYCIMKRGPKGIRKVVGYKNLDQFRKQLGNCFYGRLQDDPEVKQNLPEVITKDIRLIMTVEQSRKAVEAMDRIIEMPDGQVKAVGVLPSLIMAQQIVNDPQLLGFDMESEKLSALIEMLKGSLNGEKVIVYSKLRTMIDRIEARLKKEDIGPVVRITGAEEASQRDNAKVRFQSFGADRANIVLITKAGTKAVDLQSGNHTFLYDMPWSYGLYRQITGRTKRTGSKHRSVGLYRMIAELHPKVAALMGASTTIDGYSLEVVMKKFKLWQAVTGDVKEIDSSTSEATEIFEAIRTGGKSV